MQGTLPPTLKVNPVDLNQTTEASKDLSAGAVALNAQPPAAVQPSAQQVAAAG